MVETAWAAVAAAAEAAAAAEIAAVAATATAAVAAAAVAAAADLALAQACPTTRAATKTISPTSKRSPRGYTWSRCSRMAVPLRPAHSCRSVSTVAAVRRCEVCLAAIMMRT